MSIFNKKRWQWLVLFAILLSLVALDIYNVAATQPPKGYKLFYELDEIKREAPWDRSTVAVVRSNTPGLAGPVDPDTLGANISVEQIEAMVKLAIELTGGIKEIIDDDDKLVLIKPNMVHATYSGSGAITDCYVVKALAKTIYEAYPDVEIVVGDGPGSWVSPELKKYSATGQVVDGFERAGYRRMIKELADDPATSGLKIRLVDLNGPPEDVVKVTIPEGGWYQDTYYTHRLIVEADKVISVPVLKIHGTRVTVGIKNNVGIGPGVIYGWSKNGLDHNPAVIDKVLVDLTSVAKIDYVLVDAITALERAYSVANGSRLYRNMIVAGKDIVSVDSVAARLMGFNPDDISHVTMAALTGLGINDLEKIHIAGETIESASYYFQKNIMHKDWLGRSEEGQSCRFWTVTSGEHVKERVLASKEAPTPGKDGWSQVLYASDDFIDISQATQDNNSRYHYAFTNFYAPKDQKAELRVGSSAQMRVWIDGDLVYEFEGYRKHILPNDFVTIDLEEGNHQLLVETGRGTFNLTISEPVPEDVPDPRYPERYDGTRVHGLKFFL